MKAYHYALIASLISSASIAWHRMGDFTLELSLTKDDVNNPSRTQDEEAELTLKMFDCPECGLPAEIAGMAMDIQEDGTAFPCYIVNCFGEHSMIAVTPEWLEENALEKR